MLALKDMWFGNRRIALGRLFGLRADWGVVLPRALRRPTRFFTALIEGRVVIPQHTGSAAVGLLFAVTGLYGVVEGGHFRALMKTVTASAGFAVEHVQVAGNVETSPIDVVQRLGLDGRTSLITLDADAARSSILSLPWVADARVRKVYPDVIEVDLSERTAFAIWQHGRELSLIDRKGSVIAPFNDKFVSLPLFVGLGADIGADSFDRMLDRWPQIKRRVRASIRVADRRWNLRLDNGVTVNLPADDPAAALARLQRIEAEQELLDRDIETVDLRLGDRITVGLTEAAAARRDAAMEQRARMLKERERNS